MNSIAVGPYAQELYGWVDALNGMESNQISQVYSPHGTGLEGSVIRFEKSGLLTEIKVSSLLADCKADTFVILPYEFNPRYEKQFAIQLAANIDNYQNLICLV